MLAAVGISSALSAAAVAQEVDLRMLADRQEVAVGEAFTVEIRATASGTNIDQIALPKFNDFNVLSRRVSRPMQFSFGFGGSGQGGFQSSSSHIYQFTLQALRPGKVVIEPAVVTAEGQRVRSNPLTVMVRPGGSPPAAAPALPDDSSDDALADENGLDNRRSDEPAFLRAVVDKRDPYVGEQVTVTIYLYVRGPLRGSPSVLKEASTDGFWTQDLQPQSGTLQGTLQELRGVPYRVYPLRKFAAFPLRPGAARIGSLELVLQPGGSLLDFFEPDSPPLRRVSAPLELQVRALPPRPGGGQASGGAKVAVGSFSLKTQLDRSQATVGDALTLSAVVEGSGNLQDVRLQVPPVDGLRILDPQVKDVPSASGGRVGGQRRFEWLVIAERRGRYTLPPLQLEVFEPQQGRYLTLSGSALNFEAVGNNPAAADNDGAAAATAAPLNDNGESTLEGPARFGPLRGRSALRRHQPPLADAPWYPWAVVASPLALLLGWAIVAWRRRMLKSAAQPPRQAARRSKQLLDEAQRRMAAGDASGFYAHIALALRSSVETRLGVQLGSLTQAELRRLLQSRGLTPELVTGVLTELETCDLARFGNAQPSAATLEQSLQRTTALLRDLQTAATVEATA